WHDKRRFVHKVLGEQSALEAKTGTTPGRLGEAWRQGMEIMYASPQRRHERMVCSQPWFMVLDATGASSELFSPFGENLPEDPHTPLCWHFLSSLVFLRCPLTEISPDEWQELLTKLAENRKDLPLRGILLLFSVAELQKQSKDGLAVLGRLLRSRAQQLMLTMNRHYPVYVLIEGLEALPGMDDIFEIVPVEDFDAVLGESEDCVSARSAARSAAGRLEEMLRKASVDERQPAGDMLAAIASLKALGDKLDTSLGQFAREVAHQISTSFGSVSFCQGKRPDGQSPAFLKGLLTSHLPGCGSPSKLHFGLPFMANTKACILGAWLILTLALCGLMGVNVLYQHQALSQVSTDTTSYLHDKELDELYNQMLSIQSLKKAQQAWYLPTFGQDALSKTIKTAETAFTQRVCLNILNPLLTEYRTALASQTLSRDQEQEIGRELMWLTTVASNKLSSLNEKIESIPPFPVTTLNTTRWNPLIGRLLISAVHWMGNEGQLNSFTGEIHSLLAESLTHRGNALFEDMLTDINLRYPASQICLAQFWPHLSPSDPNNVCIQPAYTAKGYKTFNDTLTDLQRLDDKSQAITQSINVFKATYFRRYADFWVNFSKAFANIRASMQEGDVFVSYTDIHKVEDMPHYRALQQMADNFIPLHDAGAETPHWYSDCLLMDVVLDIADFEHKEEDSTTTRVRNLLSLATTAPDLLKRLRAKTKNAQQARMALENAEDLRRYLDDCLSLLSVVANPEKSYTLASAWFGGARTLNLKDSSQADNAGKNTETATKDIFANAQKQLEGILTSFKGSGHNPMLILYQGILDFIAQGVTVQTAKVVQEVWENEVLSSATALYRQDDITALFGDKGIIQTFVESRLKPFLTRKGKVLAPARWRDIEFPFTSDALHVLSEAEIIAAQPPQDTYYVQLRSQPTLVNVDARERADVTTLSLQCQDKTYTLLNRNYPREEKFQYTVKQCGPTSLEVSFPSFSLKKTYETFTDFLKDFQYGSREFSEDDFDDMRDKMEAAGVHSVNVRILPDNVFSVLQKEGNEPPTLPDRITYVW
ncbi:MAG: hypothetical protein J5846_11495, partial [Desulfovibrio sp.]|nr:hypothetical protein [Desulfovibrio sp.]